MGSTIRPELSDKNKYWIERHRYYELKHFCLQYPIWKQAHDALDGLSHRPVDLELFAKCGKATGNPTVKCAESRLFFADRIKMVEQAAMATDSDIYTYILRAVTEGIPYNTLKMQYNIPCCRDVYYDRYRKFFWLLNKMRE